MSTAWINVGSTDLFTQGLGACVKVNGRQIAVFNLSPGEWHAVQNLCPHDKRMVLSRGIIGDLAGEPKITCPLHKNSFYLKDGKHIGGDDVGDLRTYPVKVEKGEVLLKIGED